VLCFRVLALLVFLLLFASLRGREITDPSCNFAIGAYRPSLIAADMALLTLFASVAGLLMRASGLDG
jgi:hypothetical protein